MDIQFTHIFGPMLVIIAFLVFGKGIINRTRGKRFRVLPAFILMLIALSYRFIVSKETLVEGYWFVQNDDGFFDLLWDRLTLSMMDFGIGMCIDAGYLSYKKHNSKLFWVPGILALIISVVMYFFIILIEKGADEIRKPSTEWQISELNDKDAKEVELLVELGPDDTIEELQHFLKKYKAKALPSFMRVDAETDALIEGDDSRNLSQYYSVFVDPIYANTLRKELLNDPENVDDVEVNDRISFDDPSALASPARKNPSPLADDPYLGEQWFAESLAYDEVYALLKEAKPKRKAVVSIVDTGVESVHEDLKAVFGKSKGDKDSHSHGTHCAGLAGAVTNNGKGVGSLNWEGKFITIKGYPALNEQGWGNDRTVSQAIIDAANEGADVISMSLGGPGRSPAQRDAINYAFKKGAIVVVAAGNSNRDAKNYTPARIKGVIAVGALDQNLRKASFSNTNRSLKMPIAAPGVDIMSTVPGGDYKKFSGTSMATPIVAGLLGIMRSLDPDMTSGQAYKMLHDNGLKGKDERKVGRIIQPKQILEKMLK